MFIYNIQSGCTPFYIASYNGHLEILKLLFINGSDINKKNNVSIELYKFI